MKLRLTVTGHRFWSDSKKEKKKMFEGLDLLLPLLPSNTDLTFLHGCAYGVDTWLGEFARLRGINFELYFPFNRIMQIARSKYDIDFFKEINAQYEIAKKVVYVNKTFSTYGYQRRNIALVDNADILCTYYTKQRSGSGNCFRYAVSKGLTTVNLRLLEKDYEYLSRTIRMSLNPETPTILR